MFYVLKIDFNLIQLGIVCVIMLDQIILFTILFLHVYYIFFREMFIFKDKEINLTILDFVF